MLQRFLQWDVASVAPWGVVLLLALALFETYRIASLWGEEDVDKRVYPGERQFAQLCLHGACMLTAGSAL